MAYNTRYSIEFDQPFDRVEFGKMLQALNGCRTAGVPTPDVVRDFFAIPVNELARYIASNPKSDATLALGKYLSGRGEKCSWYQHEYELAEISAEVPSILITLHGEGDDADDRWRKYFKGGKVQVAKAITTFEPFDEAKLGEPEFIG